MPVDCELTSSSRRWPRSLDRPSGNTATVVIHPDRVDPSIGGEDAWHLLPGSLEDFKDVPADDSGEISKETAA